MLKIIAAEMDHAYDPGNAQYKAMYVHATNGDPQFVGATRSAGNIGDYLECVLAMGREATMNLWNRDSPRFGFQAASIEKAAQVI